VGTWNIIGLLVPSEVVMVTSLGPGLASAVIVKVAVAVTGLVTVTLVTVIPLPAVTVMPGRKRVPTRVTGELEPIAIMRGVKDDIVGVLIDSVYLPPNPSTDVASMR
jgi:hypothetical protein